MTDIRMFVQGLAKEAGVRSGDALARQWQMLMMGSIVAAANGDVDAARRGALAASQRFSSTRRGADERLAPRSSQRQALRPAAGRDRQLGGARLCRLVAGEAKDEAERLLRPRPVCLDQFSAAPAQDMAEDESDDDGVV
jgi:hypothetical protein